MKRSFGFLLIAVVICSILSGCNNNNESTTTANSKDYDGYYDQNCRVYYYDELEEIAYFVPVCERCGRDITDKKDQMATYKGASRSGIAYCEECVWFFPYQLLVD